MERRDKMKLTEAKLKQLILDEMKSNLSAADQDQLYADIYKLEQIFERMSILQHAALESYKKIAPSKEELADRRELRFESSVLQKEMFEILNKYDIPFSPNYKLVINTLKRRFRRKSL